MVRTVAFALAFAYLLGLWGLAADPISGTPGGALTEHCASSDPNGRCGEAPGGGSQ